jgi:hypothetical protein
LLISKNCLQRCAVLEDLLQALLLAPQLLRQVTVEVALAVLPVLLSIRSWDMALCLEALACTLLPSDASWPRLTLPASWQRRRICTKSQLRASRFWL